MKDLAKTNDNTATAASAFVGKNIMVQKKLTIGAANDPMEHEADAMADKVMRMPVTHFAATSASSDTLQRKCSHCEQEENNAIAQRRPLASFIQKRENVNAGNTVNDNVAERINSTRGNGNGMDHQTRSFMESRFGTGFQNIRIHADSNAAQLSQQLNAQAFTVGNDIYFNSGNYSPQSDPGKRLLAHELTHTVQQTGGQQINQPKIQRDAAAAPPRKTIWVNIGFDSSAQANETTMKKLYASIAAEKAAMASCCSARHKACNIDVKTHYDWNRVNKPAPTDGDYDSDNAADNTLRDTNLGRITAPNGGIKILVTQSTLSQSWQGQRIFPRANTGAAGVLWNPRLAADDTIAHESGHAAGYVGDSESNSHSSDPNNLMSPGSIRVESGAVPDDSWCDQMSRTAV